MRKLIKFKNENEPLSENDISFVPHFGNGAEIGGGNSNGPVGVNNGSGPESAPTSASKQQDRHHHHQHQHHDHQHHHSDRQSQQRTNIQHHGVPAASRTSEKEILTDDAERYRYDVVSAQDGNRHPNVESGPRSEDSPTVVDESDTKQPLVYIMEPPTVTSPAPVLEDVRGPVSGLRAGEFPATTAATTPQVEEPTEKIDAAVVGSNHHQPQPNESRQQHNAGDANPLNNDLSAGTNVATLAPANAATTDHRKSDPMATQTTWDTAEEAPPSGRPTANGVVRSSGVPSGEERKSVLMTTTDQDPVMQEAVQEQNVAPTTGSVAGSMNVTVRNLFGPWMVGGINLVLEF
uniref:Uncharacterized protein n=1 Tax=Anopheles stephensi TaxID=30069 RepID=A0A182Y691_ANOST